MGKAISCIVLAAGAGRRMGYKENKIFIPLGGYSIIQRTIQNVEKIEGLKEIILVVAEGEQEYMSNHIQGLDLHIPVKIVLGEENVKILWHMGSKLYQKIVILC